MIKHAKYVIQAMALIILVLAEYHAILANLVPVLIAQAMLLRVINV
jgi:hypothetical protein